MKPVATLTGSRQERSAHRQDVEHINLALSADITQVLDSPEASFWLKARLREAMEYEAAAIELQVNRLALLLIVRCESALSEQGQQQALQGIAATIAAPRTCAWLRDALEAALVRDPVDAANDAETLQALLRSRASMSMPLAEGTLR